MALSSLTRNKKTLIRGQYLQQEHSGKLSICRIKTFMLLDNQFCNIQTILTVMRIVCRSKDYFSLQITHTHTQIWPVARGSEQKRRRILSVKHLSFPKCLLPSMLHTYRLYAATHLSMCSVCLLDLSPPPMVERYF